MSTGHGLRKHKHRELEKMVSSPLPHCAVSNPSLASKKLGSIFADVCRVCKPLDFREYGVYEETLKNHTKSRSNSNILVVGMSLTITRSNSGPCHKEKIDVLLLVKAYHTRLCTKSSLLNLCQPGEAKQISYSQKLHFACKRARNHFDT